MKISIKAEQGSVWLALLIVLSSAVIPLYLSMFRVEVDGVNFRLADALSIVIIALALLIIPISRGQLFNIKILILYCLSIYMLFQSIIYNNIFSGVKEIIQLLLVGFYIVFNGWIITINRDRYLKSFILFLVLSASVTVVYHLISGDWFRYKNAGDGKYAFGLLSVILFLSWVHSKRRVYVYYFLLSIPILLLSLERKGLFGLCLVFSMFLLLKLFYFLRVKLSHLILIAIVLLIVGGILNLSNVSEYYFDKVYFDLSVNEADALYISNVHRESLIINGIQIFIDNIFFGVGVDNIYSEMESFYVDIRLANGTHNFYLDSLIKLGIFGFLFLIGLASLSLHLAQSWAAYLLILYLFFVCFFMSDGQSVLLLFLFATSAGALFPRTSSDE